jgi:hypothetical protein
VTDEVYNTVQASNFSPICTKKQKQVVIPRRSPRPRPPRRDATDRKEERGRLEDHLPLLSPPMMEGQPKAAGLVCCDLAGIWIEK